MPCHRKSGLTPKQKRFVQEYTVDLNGTLSVIRAGYGLKSARTKAATLLAKVNIKSMTPRYQAPKPGRARCAIRLLEMGTATATTAVEK